MGSGVELVADVGVAGLHRLLDQRPALARANVIVVVAGMDGALPSVVGGLVDVPVVAVPSSVGYGASFGGLSALLTMLTSCSPGVSVVNIDNGFGAGYLAGLVNRRARDAEPADAVTASPRSRGEAVPVHDAPRGPEGPRGPDASATSRDPDGPAAPRDREAPRGPEASVATDRPLVAAGRPPSARP